MKRFLSLSLIVCSLFILGCSSDDDCGCTYSEYFGKWIRDRDNEEILIEIDKEDGSGYTEEQFDAIEAECRKKGCF